MKFYIKCEYCGKQIEVSSEDYDCLKDLNKHVVCSEECDYEMENLYK